MNTLKWSKNRAGLYMQDALAEFQPDMKGLLSPPAQYKMYKNRLMTQHLIGFGSGVALLPGDVTSYAFDGSGDRLDIGDHANWDLVSDTTNYTLDLWVKFTSHATDETIISQFEDTSNFWKLHHANGNGFRFDVRTATVQIITVPYGGEGTDTNWHHYALVKKVDEYGSYVDGTQVSYLQDTSTDSFSGGIRIAELSTNPFDGNLDEIRIYQGNPFSASPNVGLSDTISVPVQQHTSDASTYLLIHCGETKTGSSGSLASFTESGINGHTVQEVGNAVVDTINYKF